MGRRAQAKEITGRLAETIANPETELLHGNPYELLVAVILSAQCTDKRVNEVSPGLFRAYPTLERMAEASAEDIQPHIASITFPNNKSRHLAGMARMVRDDFDGVIPEDPKLLQKLPGVGRKTAQVVAGAAFGADAMAVDTHVFRVSHRLALARPGSTTPEAVEQDLRRILEPGTLANAHHLFILHGRYTCTAQRPGCASCVLADICPQLEALGRLPKPIEALRPSKGRYWCATRRHYTDHTVPREDRRGVRQESCPRCGSLNVFDSRTGLSLKRVPDPRIGDPGYGRANTRPR